MRKIKKETIPTSKEPKDYTDKELENIYVETENVEKRVQLNKERILRAKNELFKIKTGYDLEKFVGQFEWSAVYADNTYQLVNEDFNVHSSKDILNLFNKKILLDSIIYKTTSASGHNGLLENINENNFIILNNIIRKITNKEQLTLSMKEFETFLKQPSFITDNDKQQLQKGAETENDKTNNHKSTNTETRTSTDRKGADRPNGLVGGKFKRNRTNEFADSHRTGDTLDDHLRKPPGADFIEDDSEFDEDWDE